MPDTLAIRNNEKGGVSILFNGQDIADKVTCDPITITHQWPGGPHTVTMTLAVDELDIELADVILRHVEVPE